MSTRDILLNEQNATYIQTFDCIRWYYRIVKQESSYCKIDVLCYLVSLDAMHNTDDYFQANTTYIANRLFYSRSQISRTLDSLVNDTFISKQTRNGNSTYIKINEDSISRLNVLYETSKEYKMIHTSTNIVLDDAEPRQQIICKFPYVNQVAIN